MQFMCKFENDAFVTLNSEFECANERLRIKKFDTSATRTPY